MGIPTFFLNILRNKFYKNVHSGVKNGEIDCNYFFLDYNGIVYSAYERIKKNIEGNNMTKSKIEEMIINEVIRYTKYLICDVVRPSKVTYIALDGPAPRAKMIQQRARRYKGYHEKIFLNSEKKRLHVQYDENEWDRSANISPGTEFMFKLSDALIGVMKAKGFSTHNPSMEVILSDSNVPGEGEHKFLPIVRAMKMKEGTKDLKVYFYGKDADLIVLAISTHKNNVHILREVQMETKQMRDLYSSFEFVDVNIDNLRSAFNHQLTRTFNGSGQSFDKMRILNDYIFLTFLVGNDFVLSMPFLKIRNDGLEILIAIYHEIKMNHADYLVIYNPYKNDAPQVNIAFFKEIIFEVSKKEDFLMKKQQIELNKLMGGYKDARRVEEESKMTPYEIISTRYTHLQVCSPDHPLFGKYHEEFKKIDYNQDYEQWSEEYYKYFFHISKDNMTEYMEMKKSIVQNYLESIIFTMKYYFQGCPSWQWHYKFRVSPLINDVYYFLDNGLIDINNISFEIGSPYTPFQQLMLILPPQLDKLVPAPLRPIMNDDTLLCTQFYPTDFRLDVASGIKTQYSEAILPEIDEELLVNTVKQMELKLSAQDKDRNIIREKPVKK